MANISAIKKLTFISVDGIGSIDVLWDSPFFDTNYAISVNMEVVTGDITDRVISVTNLSATGFTVNYVGVAGDVVTLHCIASHR
jgi:hypothetical protein